MIAKLPRWVWAGAAVLAFNGGMINAVAILGFVHKGITHVTGNCSLLSIALMEGDRGGVAQLFFIVVSFFLGSVLSGVLLGDAHLRMGRRYGLVMALESVLLVISTYGSLKGSVHGEYFVSMAAGLQNAMASTYSGAIVRTTHLTGILTDLGALAGNRLRGLRVDVKRAWLLSVILGSFIAGGLFGVASYHHLGPWAMLGPAVLMALSAAGYELFRKQRTRQNIRPLQRTSHPTLVEPVVQASNPR